jgi:non-ribosomal peptide synthetase component F
MVSIIAILKTGGAYVPIDPKYPAERIAFMLADISANIIICTESSKENLSQLSNIEVLLLDTDWPSIQTYPAHNLSNAVLPGHLIYVMYTSGSTGTPKGTMIEHRSVVSLVKGVEYVSSAEADILLSTGSSSFDATTFEYWSMLLNGGQLILCNESNLLDKDYLKAEIRRHRSIKCVYVQLV